jgi:hypothetical protein
VSQPVQPTPPPAGEGDLAVALTALQRHAAADKSAMSGEERAE